jgi:Flp pilus assembly pilin Flp
MVCISERASGGKPSVIRALQAIARDDKAATMVEYAVLASLIAAVCIAIITTMGQSVLGLYNNFNNQL